MRDLLEAAGLPVALDQGCRLVFGTGLPLVEPAVRRLDDVRGVLADPAAGGLAELYYMYRDVALPADRPAFLAQGIRFDITVVRPGRIGREYIKTAGHYHPEVPGSGLTFPEVYQVISGRAHYLLQKVGPDASLADVELVVAGPGDVVVVPPGYGHVTINADAEPLVMANLVEREFVSVYEPYVRRRGGAYYILAADGGPAFVPNRQYGEVPALRVTRAAEHPIRPARAGIPIYRRFLDDPGAFHFLVRPDHKG